MPKYIQIERKWINLDNVWWVEDIGQNYNIYFEKSTIQSVPKALAPQLTEFLNSVNEKPKPVAPVTPEVFYSVPTTQKSIGQPPAKGFNDNLLAENRAKAEAEAAELAKLTAPKNKRGRK